MTGTRRLGRGPAWTRYGAAEADAARESERSTISVSTTRLTVFLSVNALALVAMSFAAAFLSVAEIDDAFLNEARDSFVRLFLLDLEQNVPTWYSSTLFLVCSLLLARIGFIHSRCHRARVRQWFLLSLAFAYLSMDESVELHEMAIKPLRAAFDLTGYLHFAWVIPGALVVGILALSYLGFLRALPRRTRLLCMVSGVVYVGGALVIESVSGMQAFLHGKQNLTYQTISTMEEMCEMGGIIIFIYGLLDYISRDLEKVGFRTRFDSRAASP